MRDVKRRNRQVILEAIQENGSLSRIEITQRTELAASTVSTLTNELLEEGLLMEAGTVITAGRSRKELTLNPSYGSIAVIEIGRREVRATCFDMALAPVHQEILSSRYISSNDLLERIHEYIRSLRDMPPVVGIGLLFQEDMRESDFHVMYSTGFSSANITLQDALRSQYRIPVEAQYSVSYTIRNALAQEIDQDVRNSAHISFGSRILTNVTLNGRPVPIRQNFCEELEEAMQSSPPAGPCFSRPRILEYLGNLVVLLCILFPLETVFLSGTELLPKEAEEYLHGHALLRLPDKNKPKLKFLRSGPEKNNSLAIAGQVLRKCLAVQ